MLSSWVVCALCANLFNQWSTFFLIHCVNNVCCELGLLCWYRHEKGVVVLSVTGIYRELSPFSTSAVFLSTVAFMQDLYTASKVTFLLDASDTVAAYEATSTLSPTASTSSTLEGGLTAFSTELSHVQQVEALQSQFVCVCMCVCVHACMRVYVCACVRPCPCATPLCTSIILYYVYTGCHLQ